MFASLLHAYARLSGTRADGLFGAYALGFLAWPRKVSERPALRTGRSPRR
jgi:hypothetical protein